MDMILYLNVVPGRVHVDLIDDFLRELFQFDVDDLIFEFQTKI